ncbi:MAG: hypothetical protein ACTSRR_09285 [Candidatus Heimdallarchaeaceae archaeon]
MVSTYTEDLYPSSLKKEKKKILNLLDEVDHSESFSLSYEDTLKTNEVIRSLLEYISKLQNNLTNSFYDDFSNLKELLEQIKIWSRINEFNYSLLKEDIKQIKKKIKFRGDYSNIEKYLIQNSYLIPLLFQIPNEIENFFPSSKLFLELETDPEENSKPELFVYIRTKLSPDEAIKRLDEFDNTWFLNASVLYGGNICVNLEFQ